MSEISTLNLLTSKKHIIFKICYTNNNEIVKVYVFTGNNTMNLTELFKTDKNNKIFETIFSQEELNIINKTQIPVKFCDEIIYLDDTIETVKKKIIMEFDTKISFEEIYLFNKSQEKLNSLQIYQILTQNDKLELTKNRFINYLLNIDGIDISKLPNKEIYTYEDIISLNIENQSLLVNKPIGQYLVGTYSSYPYTINPFDVESYDNIEEQSDKLISTSNDSLILNYGNINLNILYLCLANDVLEKSTLKTISQETTIKLYYPFLFKKNIISMELLEENKQILLENTKHLIDKSFIKKIKSIDLFYNIYYERKNEMDILSSGIKSIQFTIHPRYTLNLSIDTLFKQIHSTKVMPLIKYNSSQKQEKIYRLYSENVSTTGKKIPFLGKSLIFKLIKQLGKNKGISFLIQHQQNDELIEMECDIVPNGSVTIKTLFKTTMSIEMVNELMKEVINPILLFIKKTLELEDSSIELFNSFNDTNIEIIEANYQLIIPIKHKINFKNNIGCISSIFAVYEGNLEKGITMRYKRVAYYNEVDSQTALIIELINKGYRAYEIIDELKENFNMTQEDAQTKLAKTASELNDKKNTFPNKKDRIKTNPGFLTTINLEKFTNNIRINVSNINDLRYLYSIEIYLNTLIRLSQDPDSTNVSSNTIKQICKGKTITEETKIEDIIALPELPYKDSQSIEFQNEQLIIEPIRFESQSKGTNETDESDEEKENVKETKNILDLLYEEEEEDEEEMEGGKKQKQYKSDDSLSSSSSSSADQEIPQANLEQSNLNLDNGKKNKTTKQVKIVTNQEQEQDIADITGMTLNKPNPFFRKLENKEPTLFLTNVDKEFKAYSRACPYNNRRQPVLLTDDEKQKIDKDHPGSYTEAIKYGTDPKKKFWYICPRYWDLKRNVSLTETEVKSGKYGKVIPLKTNKVPPGANIYEFTDDKYHLDKDNKYINLYPGFLKDKVHPEGLCVPCCFKYWDTPEQTKRRSQCLIDKDNETDQAKQVSVEKETAPRELETEQYIKGPEKMPLEPGRWGYLPIAIQKFLRSDNKKCYISNTNTNLKENYPCLLRHGVEINRNQSFIACIADVYIEETKTNTILSIKQMKQKIIDAVSLDIFISLQNGNLIQIFNNTNIDVIIENYKKTEIYKVLNMNNLKDLSFMKKAISSYETFIQYLKDDESLIEHKYLWDIVCTPNPKLFTKGLNLIIMELERNDITDNVNVLCPSNHYSNSFFNVNKYSLLLLKIDNFYEPIYTLEDKVKEWEIKRIFNLKNKSLLPNLRNTLEIIKTSFNDKCQSFNSMPKVYNFKTNIILFELVKHLKNINYNILHQIINYNGKIIGVIAENKKNIKGFIPCYPSAYLQDSNIPIMSMDELSIWNTFQVTFDYLIELSRDSSKKIPCLPKLKVLEDGLIIGIITETNQFIAMSEPEQNTMELEMPVIESSNYNTADSTIMTSKIGSEDEERIKYIKYIKLESGFYDSFRNTIRILLNQYRHKSIKNEITKIIKSPTLLYTNKLKKIITIIKQLTSNYVEFIDYSETDLMNMSQITSCLLSDNCEENTYCKYENRLCKIKISRINLINKLNNEVTYFGKIADELIRYNTISAFILQNKSTNISSVYKNIKYNINENEIILLQSLLTQEYFDELTYESDNKYVKTNTYDTSEPNLTVSYSNIIERLLKHDVENKYDNINCTLERTERVGGKLSTFFPKDTIELIFGTTPEICSFRVIETIINDNNSEITINTNKLKQDLIEEYEKYKDYMFEIIDILIKQGKQFANQVIVGQLNIQDMIMSDNYYATNLDIWILAKKYNIPLIFLSGTTLMENNEFIFVANSDGSDKYYFIKSPGISNLKVPKYRLFINGTAKIPVTNFSIDNQTLIRSKENQMTLDTFIEQFIEKKIRKPRKDKEKLKLVLEENEPLQEKQIVKKKRTTKKGKVLLLEE